MKQITKNLITYQADIHATLDEIDRRLPHFEPIGPHQRSTCHETVAATLRFCDADCRNSHEHHERVKRLSGR